MLSLCTRAQSHPDLKLWRQPWKSSDGSLRKGSGHSGVTTPSPPSPLGVSESTESESLSHKQPNPTPYSFQTSYISSEHCYQKPHAYYPALEQRLVVETRSTEELLDFELSNTKVRLLHTSVGMERFGKRCINCNLIYCLL